MNEPHLLYEVRDRAAWLTINRPDKRNAISPEAMTLFAQALDRAEQDEAVRVVVVTGAGDKAFCSGADLGGSLAGSGGDVLAGYAALITRLATFSKPTVARINGHCLAGGTGFMLACDIVIARDTAQFGTPEVNVGLFPMMIGALIFRNVPRKKAMEMILLGERLTAAQALEMGMVTRVCPADTFESEVAAVVATLSEKSPIGMKIGKLAFAAAENMPLGEAVKFLSGKLAEVAATQDAVEGITAFIQKRKPDFTGK
ncbi:MAG: enoyl-CoA hydratase-related protein [Thermodesulfobacteriota bacterium]